jgi:hypothetical protein
MPKQTLTWKRDGSIIRLHREVDVTEESSKKTIVFKLETPYQMFPTPDGKSATSNFFNFKKIVFPGHSSNAISAVASDTGKDGKFVALAFSFSVNRNADAKDLSILNEMADTFQEFICSRIDGLFDEMLKLKSEVAHSRLFAKGTFAGLVFIRGEVPSLDLQTPLPEQLIQELKAEVRYFSKVTLLMILSAIVGLACIVYGENGGNRYFVPGSDLTNTSVLLFFCVPVFMLVPVGLFKPKRRHGSRVSSNQSYGES